MRAATKRGHLVPQQILDLDLDFFLDKVYYSRTPNRRVSSKECHPWTADDVREFLEVRCGLSRGNRIPGRFIKHHDKAFEFWRELILGRRLISPFDVVHVDAHAGLGLFALLLPFFLGEFLHQPIEARRVSPKSNGQFKSLNAGNYLCFAIAFRWLANLTYVKNLLSQDDLTRPIFRDRNPHSGAIRLPVLDPASLDDPLWIQKGLGTAVAFEPEVGFLELSANEFVTERPFDFMVPCHSPGFTPKSADSLLPIICEYMEPI
jgi:hypothetical protein